MLPRSAMSMLSVAQLRGLLRVKFWKGFGFGLAAGYIVGAMHAMHYYASRAGAGDGAPPAEPWDCGQPDCADCAQRRPN